MNWYKKAKELNKEDEPHEDVLDTQLLCCGYPENKRKDPYKRKEGPNYPGGKNNEIPNGPAKTASAFDIEQLLIKIQQQYEFLKTLNLSKPTPELNKQLDDVLDCCRNSCFLLEQGNMDTDNKTKLRKAWKLLENLYIEVCKKIKRHPG